MKKFLLSNLLFLLALGLSAQVENFDGIDPEFNGIPEGWSRFIDGTNDNDSLAWKPVYENALGNELTEDSVCMKFNEWFIAADLWLVTPKFTATAQGLTFKATDSSWRPSVDGGDDNDRVNLEVYVCTYDFAPEFSDDFEVDPVLVIPENDNSDYEEYTLDLSAYVGQDIYVGFVVKNQSTWADSWWLDDVDFPIASSVEQIEVADPLNIFPNPSNGTFTLSNVEDGSVVEVLNVAGQVVSTQQVFGTNQTLHLDVDSGAYYVKVSNANSAVVHKLIIQD